jgi:Cu2+-exporting ATPase
MNALLQALACFHCGQDIGAQAALHVDIDGASQPMCCPGCAAVAQAIVDNGMSAYYRERAAFAATASLDALPPQLALYDAPQELARHARESEGMLEATLCIEGLRCAACVWLIERRLARLAGVQSAQMNLASERLALRWDPARTSLAAVLAALAAIGYRAYPYDAARREAGLRAAAKALSRRLFVAGLAMMQVMMYAVPAYLARDGSLDPDMEALLRWASLLLTLPALLYSASPFFRGALAALRSRALSMDVPVALGIAAAFGASTAATIAGRGEVYFDSVTMFIFLLLCSRWLELLARRRAAEALERLQHGLPASAQRLDGWPRNRAASTVAADSLLAGDVVLVAPGAAVPADGILIEGASRIDLSLLSGESRPQARVVGDEIPGGAVNIEHPLLLRLTRPAAASTLAQLVRMAEGAGQGKPVQLLWADRVAAWFVAGLLLLALLVFAWWHAHEPARAWMVAVAVLVVSCPCALSLATPSALAAATDGLLRVGVLIVRPHVLETLHRATHVVFDKTGTLTLGQPLLREVALYGNAGRGQCLRLAAALEAGSAHPLARAIRAAAGAGGADLQAQDQQQCAGQGVSGVIDGVRYRLGRADYVAQLCPRFIGMQSGGAVSSVYLGSAAGVLARFDIADGLREDARAVVERFAAAGKQLILLSGDGCEVTREVAAALGIARAHGAQTPQQKLEFVQGLQRDGAVVAMVGDGINDAAVLSAADVSFAMGSGAALAQAHADAVLLSGRLSTLATAARMANAAMAVVRQNLAWAMAYNAIAIPAAACGLINPWVSGIGMSASSMLVVGNALRLRRAARNG